MANLFRKGRLRAFQTLFEADFGFMEAMAVLTRRQADEPLSSSEARYAEHLVTETQTHREEIDRCIQETAPAWPVAQISPVDRTALRIALYELLFNNAAVPSGAVINEAVELAKTYGSDGGRRFVNGVLGTISRERVAVPVAAVQETEEPRGLA